MGKLGEEQWENEGYEKTVRAANVYKKILIALEEAREAATSALSKAISAYEKVRFYTSF